MISLSHIGRMTSSLSDLDRIVVAARQRCEFLFGKSGICPIKAVRVPCQYVDDKECEVHCQLL